VRYISTRGEAPILPFKDVLLAGLATDGGLYVPETWPALTREAIAGFAGRPYAAVAAEVIGRFTGEEIDPATLRRLCDEAYATFRHPAVCPLVQVDDRDFILELFHGPTLAFKDVAMQLLGRLMDLVLAERNERATIVGATSGDTGGAAIEAFRGRSRADIFILFPHGRVSDVQRLQMTTAPDGNVHAIAVEGTFDDCQAIVKAMFGHAAFRDGVKLSGVNSINWARIVAQVVYYVTAAASLGSPHRPVAFSVPTGNFGDIFAGWVARRMGVPMGPLMIASNVNDILTRTLSSGAYEVRGVVPSTSPSMDIQVSSNFERLLFEAGRRDASSVRRAMQSLAQSKGFAVEAATLAAIRTEFLAASADNATVARTIADWTARAGYLLDPHTAVGLHAAQAMDVDMPRVTLATAHPAKFPDAVEAACGGRPALPDWLADLPTRRERYDVLPADQGAIETYIRARSRAAARVAV
jgi:threonine synthase